MFLDSPDEERENASSADALCSRRGFGGVLLARARPALGANALCLRASQQYR
jgi:hypothetical protein